MLAVVGSAAAANRTPNLLVIVTAERHYNTIGCYGGTIVKTPNIDWHPKDGTLCGRFCATTPV